jgi:O-acetyl-ADP-ribose deacetylase (regulator of RNase III)
MNQTEKRLYLIQTLLQERKQDLSVAIPPDALSQKRLLRSLLNVRPPMKIGADFLAVQDDYLSQEIRQKGITYLSDLTPIQKGIYLWQGDITTLACDAIVNAANSQMLGCFCPCHGCIDNAIHTFSGIQLRLACAELMEKQGREEETGQAKITPAFNLPSRYVLHTVGPIVQGELTQKEEDSLASCYRSCLELADENGLKSVAFCCISTGEFHFPREKAAKIAIQTVQDFQRKTQNRIEVIFNVFQDRDYTLYQKWLRSC